MKKFLRMFARSSQHSTTAASTDGAEALQAAFVAALFANDARAGCDEIAGRCAAMHAGNF